ncbi:MAG: ABC transporter permease [Pseudomonadota bacterium]
MSTRLTIARWEFFRFFKWKSELISLLITAALFSAGFLVTPLISWVKSTDDQTLVLLGNLPEPSAFEALPLTLQAEPENNRDAMLAALADGAVDGVAQWHPEEGSTTLTVMREPAWLATFEAAAGAQALPQRLAAADLSRERFAGLVTPAPTVLAYHADAAPPAGRFQKLLGVAAIVLPMIGVFSAFSYFFVSITAEKQNRLGEQVLSAVGHRVWLDGKLLGLTALCLKSMITLAIMGAVGIAVYFKFTGKALDPGYVDPLAVLLAFGFALLAVTFWSGVMASLAATISDPNSSTRGGLMMLPGLFMLLPLLALDVPTSFGVTLLSIIPVTSTAFMPMRLVLGEVPWWQLLLSAALMIGAIALVRLAAQRVLKVGILMFGREPNWAEVWRAIRQPDLEPDQAPAP